MRYKKNKIDSTSNKAFKSGIWYTTSNFLVKSIGFITTPIFTRLLTKAEFGLYNNYISWLAIITILVTWNLESTLISARYDYEKRFDEYILSILTLSTISVAFWILVVNIFSTSFCSLLGMDQVYINIMLVYLLFFPTINLFQARERYRFEYKKIVTTSLFIAVGTAILSLILVLKLSDHLFGRIIGSVIPTVFLGMILYFYFIKKGKIVKFEYWKYALPICFPYIPHLLSLTLLNSMDRTMITRWCSAEDTAMYSVAYTCGSMVTLLMTSMNSAYAPWLCEKINLGKYTEIRKFSRIYILGFSFFAVGIMAVAPEALFILGGQSYLEAQYLMTPIAMGCICQFLYTMFVNVEQFKKKTVGMAIASLTAAVVNFVLNYIFIPRVGYLAAAYTTLVGYLCLLGIHMYLVYQMGLNDIYDYKMTILIVVVMICITIVITLLYSHQIIRYIFVTLYILLFVIFVLKNRNKIIEYVKKRL